MKKLLTILFFSLAWGLTLQAQSVSDLKKEQKKLQDDMALTQKMLKETKRSETATNNKLNLLNQNIKTQKKLISNLDREIGALDREMTQLSSQRDSLIVEQELLLEDYARLVRESHYQQIHLSPLLFVLSSQNFNQLVRRVRYLREFVAYRQFQIEKLQNIKKEVQLRNELLSSNRREKATALTQQQRQKESLDRDQKKHQQMLSELKKKEKNLANKQKQQQKRIDEINRKIDSIVQEQTRKQSKDQLTKEQKLLDGGFAKNKGRLPWPVSKGIISHHFGREQRDTYVVTDNKGIYIQTTKGEKARAVFDGEVTAIILLSNTYAVIVQHGSYRTVYGGLSVLSVKKGDKVTAKQNLGTIFSDPNDDNKTELYFQIYEEKTIRNPEVWLSK